MNLKKNWKVFTSKFVETGPSSYLKKKLPGRGLTKVEKHCYSQGCLEAKDVLKKINGWEKEDVVCKSFFCTVALRPYSVTWPYGALRPHTLGIPHLVGLLWTSDQPDTETSVWQHTTLTGDIHAHGGIRTYSLMKQAFADPRLRLRGHGDRRI